MKRTITLLVVALLALTSIAIGQDEADYKKTEENMVMMATPGEHHEHLAMLAGDYTYKAKAWMAPGQPPMEWEGERSAKMILGGRYLQEMVSGSMMGQPFEGIGMLAYDNMNERYVHTWYDNLATGVTTSYGACSKEDGWTLKGEHFNPMVGQNTNFRMVLKPGEDGFVFEWYEAIPGAEERRTMEITYTKKG